MPNEKAIESASIVTACIVVGVVGLGTRIVLDWLGLWIVTAGN